MSHDVITHIPEEVLADLSVDPAILVSDPVEIRAMSADSSMRSKKAEANDRPLAAAALVVRPDSTEQVSRVLAWATKHGIPVTPRGLGSGTVGAGLPIRGGVVLDLAEMNEIGEVDVTNRMVTVGAGVRLSDLDEAIAPTGLSVGHYPQSFYLASVGGSIAMRGSGTFSSLHGNMDDRVGDLEVVLPTGEIVTTHSMPRASLGPDLKQLFAGSEGMLGIITKVTLRLVPLPAARRFNSVRYETFEQALEAMRLTLIAGVRPAVVRIYDPVEASAKHAQFAEQEGWLTILVFDGDADLVAKQEEIALRLAAEHGGTVLGPEPAVHWEQRRFNWSWFTDAVDHEGGAAEAIEVSAAWSELPALYERMKAAGGTVMPEFMAHVSHVYDQGAALYAIVRGQFADDAEALTHYDAVWEAVVTAAQDSGAVMGHHHGVGLERAPWMERGIGAGSMNLLRKLSKALDPAGIMNPGKAGL
jgi:alkyldihydroxyacetonephosphate synthase